MSMSDSDSSHTGDHKYFRQITRDRLLHEMLGSTKKGDSRSTWKVLIMDRLTVKIMSYACKMADITEAGVSLVEDIYKRRQPLPTMDAIYFIQPSKENVIMFLSDMAGKKPLYKKAFVFFSSPITRELVGLIKKDATVLPRIGALSEMNLEYFSFDRQGFVTDNGMAMEELFGNDENHRKADACLSIMAARAATAFASMRELPFVRYRAAKSLDTNTMTTYRDLVPTKLAAGIWNHLTKYKTSIANFPQTETCELLVLDRSVDQIAPVIHEWTYDAMCHDLLFLEGNKYVYEVPSKTGGPPEKKEVLLEEHDPIWCELRHLHIADASERLHEKMTNFVSKNKAAQIHHSSRLAVDLMPIAGKINRIIREQKLREVGKLEQDLVFGDAGTKEVIKFLSTHTDLSRENKLRLLMVYAAIYPEKFEGDKGSQLMQLAGLLSDDTNAVNNMKLLGTHPETKKSSIGAFALKFDNKELVEKLSKGELPKNEYPCMNDPSPTSHGATHPAAIQYTETPVAHSMRSRRTPTWASRPRNSDDGYSSDSILRHASSDFKKMGRRIFVFIVGGATRSELRACHKLTTKLNREVILGSSSVDDPPQFITKLKLLSSELSLDDLEI
uniref:SNARE-interacting protein KEULE n=1 Tax=Chenopodium quinoa TaxID=63459 RepID=A0A803N1M1_CHEQI